MSKSSKRKYWASAFELTAVYVVVCALYITFSSRIAAAVARDVEHLQQIETLKGYLFVAVTALLLFVYARFMLKRDSQRQHELHLQRMALMASEQRNLSSQMAWTIGHDINNILTIIAFNIDLLEERLGEGGGTQKLVSTLESATDRLRFLARKMRDSGRNMMKHERIELSLRPVIDDAVELAQMVRANMTSTVTVDCPPDLKMEGCASVIQQALFNLLINAMDAVDLDPCVIEIAVQRTDGGVTLAVHDNGPGVPAEQQAKIFETFYTTKEQGSGIGLLSAQLCAKMHEGTLTVCRSRLGGACFCLNLPAKAAATGRELNYAI